MPSAGLGAFAQNFGQTFGQALANRPSQYLQAQQLGLMKQRIDLQNRQTQMEEEKQKRQGMLQSAQAMSGIVTEILDFANKTFDTVSDKVKYVKQAVKKDPRLQGSTRLQAFMEMPPSALTEDQFNSAIKAVKGIANAKTVEDAMQYDMQLQTIFGQAGEADKAMLTRARNKAYSNIGQTEMQTIYGPQEATKRVSITKGQEYVPPAGWSLSKPSGENYDEQLFIAAQAIGIDVEKVKNGKLTKEEAINLADEYAKRFGTQSLLGMLFGGAITPSGDMPLIQYDREGNRIQ